MVPNPDQNLEAFLELQKLSAYGNLVVYLSGFIVQYLRNQSNDYF